MGLHWTLQHGALLVSLKFLTFVPVANHGYCDLRYSVNHWWPSLVFSTVSNHWTNHWYQWFNGKKTIDTNGSTAKNHWKTIVSNEKTLEKPLIPMVEMWKTIDNDGSLVKKNHWKTIDHNGTLTKTIDIPSCPKIYHRRGLHMRLSSQN